MNDHLLFMEKTILLAREGMKEGELPIASLLTHNNKIIAQSYTKERTEKRRLVHAELLTLEEADKHSFTFTQRREMVLYTNLEPCMMCLGAAMTFGVGIIVYGLKDKSGGVSRLITQLNKSTDDSSYFIPKIIGEISVEENIQLFKLYLSSNPRNKFTTWVLQLLDNLSS